MSYRRLLGLVLIAAVSGCASSGPAKTTATSAAPAPAALPPATAAASNGQTSPAVATPPSVAPASTTPPSSGSAAGLPAFAQLIKDARKIDGPLTVWQKDEKVWLELGPEHWGQPYLLSPKLRTGMGEGGVLGGLMASIGGGFGGQVVEFTRVYNQVRLLARNQMAVATTGTPQARAVEVALSPSLLGSSSVASQPTLSAKLSWSRPMPCF